MPEDKTPKPLTRDDDEMAELVLAVLVERHPTLVAFEELVAELSVAGQDRSAIEAAVETALGELSRLGLAHRVERFAFASHTAIRARQLSVF